MNKAGVLAACLLLAGCTGGDQDDLQSWMEAQVRGMRGAVRQLPELRPFPVVGYAGEQGDDPFRSARMAPQRVSGSSAGPDMNRRREPLEGHALETLQMVGVLTRDGVTHALIRAGNALHQVRPGNYMGQDFGVVIRVTENEVTLRELVEDVYGDWVERTRSLILQERQEAGK